MGFSELCFLSDEIMVFNVLCSKIIKKKEKKNAAFMLTSETRYDWL